MTLTLTLLSSFKGFLIPCLHLFQIKGYNFEVPIPEEKKIPILKFIEKTAIVIVKVRFKVNVKLSKNEEMLTANGNLILERKLEVLH